MDQIAEYVAGLSGKDNNQACQCLKELQRASEESNVVYSFFDFFVQLMEHDNSYIRTRGILLIAANAKWDKEGKIERIIDLYLKHISDEKPITARQCIQSLPFLVRYKPQLKKQVEAALLQANPSGYADSMRPLISKDITSVLVQIHQEPGLEVVPTSNSVVLSESRSFLTGHKILNQKTIRQTTKSDFETIHEIINDAARAYRGIIPMDRWHEPYMSKEELHREIADGVLFFGYEVQGYLLGVLGIQNKGDVALLRHAYVRTVSHSLGIGGNLLDYLCKSSNKPLLVGTWADSIRAIHFYEKHGFHLIEDIDYKNALLHHFWTIPERQVETSVVLANSAFKKIDLG